MRFFRLTHLLLLAGSLALLNPASTAAPASPSIADLPQAREFAYDLAQRHGFEADQLLDQFARIRSNPRIDYYTLAEVTGIEGKPGDFTVQVKQNPRFVNAKCTGCGKCSEAVEATTPMRAARSVTEMPVPPHSSAEKMTLR